MQGRKRDTMRRMAVRLRMACSVSLLFLLFMLSATLGCSSRAITLRPPACATLDARSGGTPVDLEPLESAADSALAPKGMSFGAPGPAVVLTSGISSELKGRGLSGGEPGGYS